ncbi:MAG: peptide chain release factor 3, partial [Ilumatobacteraceae bacterium]|nr:peptide chain release factor 3 [Ilumatobacteraceae bacterium]
LDEIEKQIQLRPTPVTWPVGDGEEFQGLIDRRTGRYTRFTRTARGASAAAEETTDLHIASAAGSAEHGAAWKAALDQCELLDAIGANVDMPSFLAGQSTPVFVGSALTNFGVRLLLDSVIEMAPSPSPRFDRKDEPRELDSPFSAFVFKVQANMDPSHRDRIAFARICSGRFERGMSVTNHRTGRDITTKYATTAFGPDRETVDEAFPGDVVGLVNATGVQLGDTLYDAGYAGLAVEFPPIPKFSPEVFAKARPLDNGRFKQFRKGLAQLDEEGVVQVLRDPDFGESETILAAVGELQFEVFAYRLGSEFGAPTEIVSAPYQAIRLTDKESSERLRRIGGIRVLTRGDGALVALFENRYRLQRLESDEPELTLLPIVAG